MRVSSLRFEDRVNFGAAMNLGAQPRVCVIS
jgi:hypothetical protein